MINPDKVSMAYTVKGSCGDELKTIPDETIDLIVTDPPYGINYKSNKQNCDTRSDTTIYKDKDEYFEKISGDDKVPVEWLDSAYRVLKNNSAIYIFGHWSTWHLLRNSVVKVGFDIKNMIILNKSNHGMGDLKGSFASKYEVLLFAVKGRHLLHFPNGRANDIWDVPVKFSGAHRLHPNEKPISWIIPCIENSSKEGDVILDPFAGSCSVAEACILLNRRCISIEESQNYFDIGIERIKKAQCKKMNILTTKDLFE